MNKIIFFAVFTFCFVIFCNCGSSETSKKDILNGLYDVAENQTGQIMDINIDRIVQIINNSDCNPNHQNKLFRYYVVYYFNGACASCIADFIQWNKSLEKILFASEVFVSFINYGKNQEIVNYYVEEHDVEFGNCIFHDADRVIGDSMLELENKMGITHIFLIDEEGVVLAYGDPFLDNRVKEVYKEYGIFWER